MPRDTISSKIIFDLPEQETNLPNVNYLFDIGTELGRSTSWKINILRATYAIYLTEVVI